MADLAIQTALVLGVLATFFVGPGLAIAFLIMRKRRRRARGRSPIGIDLLRTPGHTVREQLDDASADVIWDVMVLGLAPMVLLATYLAQAHVIGLSRIWHLTPLYVGGGLLVILVVIRKMVKAGERIDNLRAGFDAELAVGQELDKLMLSGARVFHDFPAENFNIDHVVISAQGVFAVETKGYTKPGDMKGREGATVVLDDQALRFPHWTTSEPLEQAERQAKWLSKWMTSALGQLVFVTPVVALPGWYVDDKRRNRNALRVYSGRALEHLLDSPSRQPLIAQDVQRIAHQVDQRCRTVVPTYRRDAQQS
jgi:hypothetical protein